MNRLDLFFSYSFDLLAIVGPDGYFKRVNPAFERVLGYSEQELYSKPIAEFLHPDDVKKTQTRLKTLASGSPTMASINRYRCKDDSYKWLSWNTNSVDGLFYSVGRDITEQRISEERIRQLNLQLEQKNEELEEKIQERVRELQQSEAQVQQLQKMDAIGRLAGGIAHDFNNVLSAISLYCDLLSDDQESESVLEYVQDIRKVTDRAAALTRQLLIFSRKQVVQLQVVNVNTLIQQLEKMLVRLIGENISFKSRLAGDLRAIKADASQIEQVVLNLVVNARDALPNGGTILVETSNVYLDEAFSSKHLSVNRGHYVLLAVSDDGIGMDAATSEKIFEPFFTTKPVGKGTGLGLTTTYGIIKQSQGTIWVYSEPGKGTVFKVYLPTAENLIEEPELNQERQPDLGGNQTILLVEDDEKLRKGFSILLQRKGYHVLVASEANEALEFCKNHDGPIHLLLTDIVMPGLTGFELAKQALLLRDEIRVLYMSGYTNDALEKSGRERLGDLEFIQKPFSANVLVAKLLKIFAA